MPKPSNPRWLEGQIVRVDLKNGTHSFGRVLRFPFIAFYDHQIGDGEDLSIDVIVSSPIAFVISVMRYAVTSGRWPVIGRVRLTSELNEIPAFFKQDAVNGELSIYQEVPELAPLYERPATLAEVQGLECAAVWEPEHVEERLRDHFAGRPNKWVELLRLKTESVP
jgi:hypothetical protein